MTDVILFKRQHQRLGKFIQKLACVFLLRSMREVTLRGGTERGIHEKIRVGLVERENKQNDHARLIVLCNGKDSPDQKGRKSRALNADNTSF